MTYFHSWQQDWEAYVLLTVSNSRPVSLIHTLSNCCWCLRAFHGKRCCLLNSNPHKNGQWKENSSCDGWWKKKIFIDQSLTICAVQTSLPCTFHHLYRHGDMTIITTVIRTKNLVLVRTSLLWIKQCSPSVLSKWVYAVHSNTFITMVTKQLFATFCC